MPRDALDQGLLEHFGFPAFRPGQREACHAALDGRDALVVMPTGSGKVALLPASGAAAGRPDRRGVPAGGPHAGPGRGPGGARARRRGRPGQLAAGRRGQPPASSRVPGTGRCACCTWRRSDSPRRASASGWRGADRPLRGGRGALRLAVGPRLPSRLLPPGRPRQGAGRPLVDGVHGHRHPAGGRRHPAAAGPAEPRSRCRPASTVPTSPSWWPGRPRTRSGRFWSRRCEPPDALPAIVYAGTRAGAEETAGVPRRRARGRGAGLPRGSGPRAPGRRPAALPGRRGARSSWPPTPSGWGSTSPTSGPSSTSAFRPRSRPTTRRPGARGATAAPSRALLLAEGRDKALHVHFIKRDELDEAVAGKVATAIAAKADADGAYEGSAAALAAHAGLGADALRALIGHLARARIIDPAPAPPDRLAGRLLAPLDRRSAGLVRASAAEGVRARWRQYREIWAYVEGGTCRRAAILRHFGDAADPAPAGRVLRRLRSGACRERATAGPARDREPRPGHHPRGPCREPAGRPHHLRRDPPRRAHQEDRAERVRRPARPTAPARRCGARTSSPVSTS